MLAYIPFTYFTLWLIIHFARPNMRFGAGAMCLLWVDISAFFAILIDARNLYDQFGCNEYSITAYGVLLYCLLWTIILAPLMKLDGTDITISPHINKPILFKVFCLFLILCMFIHIVFADYLSFFQERLMADSADNYAESVELERYRGGANQFILWIPNIIASFTPLYLLCWIISITICKQSKLIRICLLGASMLAMFVGFAYGGRAQLLWWCITFLIYFFLFKPQMSPTQRKYINAVFLSFAGIAFIGIMIITLSRFDDGSSQALDSIIGYAGQQVNNFCALLPYVDFAHLYPDRVFPLYQYVVKGEPYDMIKLYSFLSNLYPIRINVFFTLFGGLLIDTGIVGLIVFLLLYVFISQKLIHTQQNTINISQLFIWSLLFCIPVRGLFGWPFTTYNNSLYIFFSIGLFILFNYTFKFGRNKSL